jgi:hypothetical protein
MRASSSIKEGIKMKRFYEDFLRIWKRVRDKTDNSDKIVEQLKKEIDFKNLSPHDKIVGKPCSSSDD